MRANLAEAEPLMSVLDAWNDLDGAINRILTALPGQMTSASERLDAERLTFRKLLQDTAMAAARAKSAAKAEGRS